MEYKSHRQEKCNQKHKTKQANNNDSREIFKEPFNKKQWTQSEKMTCEDTMNKTHEKKSFNPYTIGDKKRKLLQNNTHSKNTNADSKKNSQKHAMTKTA